MTCPSATIGQQVTCNASGGIPPYVWSLTAGSAGSIDSSGNYTAPASIIVQQKSGPCQMLPPDHVFNTRIDALPVLSTSAAIIALTGVINITMQPSWSTNVIDNSLTATAQHFFYTSARDGNFQIPVWPSLYRESGVFTAPFSGVDRHHVTVNRETCEFTDVYNAYSAGEATIPESCPTCTAQSGIKYSNGFSLPDTSISSNGATDAASMYLQPLVVKASDLQAGEIKHALRFTMANGYINPSYIWPAKAASSVPNCTGDCWKFGMRARLKAAIDISGFSATAQMFLLALKRYGMFLTDGGTSWGIQVDGDVMLDSSVQSALAEIQLSPGVPDDDFEVVDESSLQTPDVNSGAVSLSNGYVTPSQYAEVVATDSSAQVGKARVVLQGVAVGVPDTAMTIMAGMQIPLTAWVTGTANTGLTWAMSPSLGNLSSTGIYESPTGLSTPSSTRITITSIADSSAKAYIDILVWPDADGNGNGVIRMMPGYSSPSFTDSKGHKWWGAQYARMRGYGGSSGVWTGGAANTVYSATKYTYDDLIFRWYMPNGLYNLKLYTSINTGAGTLTDSDFLADYDIQGTLPFASYPVNRLVGTARFTGGFVDLPFVVTDRTAYVSIRNLVSANPYQSVSAIEIQPRKMFGDRWLL